MTKEVGYMVFNGSSGHGLYDSLTEAIERAKLEKERSPESDVYVQRDVLISEVVYKVPKQKTFRLTNKWRLVNYFDVWGNATDGWEVNDLCKEDKFLENADEKSNEELIAWLRDIGFLTEYATMETVEVWNDGDMIEFSNTLETDYPGYPLCRLERVYE